MSATLFAALIEAGLEPEPAKALAAIPHQIVDVEPRRTFREKGDAHDEVMFVTSGLLCKFKTDGMGRRLIVGLRFPGEGILPGRSKLDYGIQAVSPSRVMIGKEEDLAPIVRAHPEINRFFFRLVQRETAINYEWMINTGRRDSLSRVAHLILETATRMKVDANAEGMLNPFTQQQIADITGQTSVNVNRVIADLERRGLIRREGKRIFFEDEAEMRRMASFDGNYLD